MHLISKIFLALAFIASSVHCSSAANTVGSRNAEPIVMNDHLIPQGSQVLYAQGSEEILAATISEVVQLGDIHFAANTQVTYASNRAIISGVLAETYQAGAIVCQAGGEIYLYSDGRFGGCRLANDVRIDGTTAKSGSLVALNQEGRLLTAIGPTVPGLPGLSGELLMASYVNGALSGVCVYPGSTFQGKAITRQVESCTLSVTLDLAQEQEEPVQERFDVWAEESEAGLTASFCSPAEGVDSAQVEIMYTESKGLRVMGPCRFKRLSEN